MRDPRFAKARTWEQYNRATSEQIEKARLSARAVANGPTDTALLKKATEALEDDRPSCWHAFHDEFVAAARETPDRQAAWAHALGEAFVTARDGLESSALLKSEARDFHGAIALWKQEKNPFSVWDRLPYVHLLAPDSIRHWTDLLIRVHPEQGLRAIDTIPYPGLMSEILSLHFREDRDLIEDMIKAAPRLLDSRGCWSEERSVAALFVTKLITKHAEELDNILASADHMGGDVNQTVEAEQTRKSVQEDVLRPWMEHAFDLLLQRPDGLKIALGYLGHLSRRQLLGRGQHQDGQKQWTAQSAALTALAATLKRASVSVARMRATWEAAEQLAFDKEREDAKRNRVRRRPSGKRSEREGEGAGTLHVDGLPYLLGSAVLLGDAPHSEAELEMFWSWFEELLERRDPGLSLITHSDSLTEVPRRFGFLLSRLPSPAARLRASYEKLEPQRRRALFAHHYEEIHHDLESVVLLRVGINAAANWLDRVKMGQEAEAARELFFWIDKEARRLWLTAVLDVENSKKQLISTFFAFMPFLFGEALGEALKRVIAPIAPDAKMLSEACAMLALNGVEAAKLPALIADAGADLIAALHDVHQWSELTGRKEDFPEHLQKLAAELGIDFAQPVVAPESERTSRLREAFAEAIPWGAALLRRLEDDGCSRVRAVPLDQPGSTWVLQATLPEALRNRFGLVPDIRILAVHGQPRGHDLRRAVEEPEGIADVDPDLLVVASQSPDLGTKLSRLAGPWGQRVPWPLTGDHFAPLADRLQEHLPTFDLFERRDPVRGRAFLGRRREVDAIAERLLRGQTVGVFGLRKVGKSSLLQAVAEAIDPAGAALAALGGRARSISEAPAEALVVWLDVQSLVVRTRDAIAERLWEGLKARLDATGISTTTTSMPDEPVPGAPVVVTMLREEAPSKDPLDNLRRLLLAALGRREVPPVCFILDEYDLLFEGYGGEPAVAGVEQIFALLRGLGQATGRVSLALIGRDPVFAEQPHLNGFTNPLLGWVEPFHLGPFSDDDATELLQRLGKRVGLEIGPTTVQHALRWTGGHPLLLREYGSALHEVGSPSRSTLPTPTDPLRERAAALFLQRDAVHTICGEIETLLETRFLESLALLQRVANAPEQDAQRLMSREASTGRVAKVLFDFGVLRGTPEAPWLPLLYREHFRTSVPESRILQRSQSHAG